MKKPKPSTVRRKALKEWSKSVRDRDSNTCQVCGAVDNTQAHHIFEKRYYKELMYDINVGITLCPTCHIFGKYSFHKNPLWSVEWLKINKAEVYKWCKERL